MRVSDPVLVELCGRKRDYAHFTYFNNETMSNAHHTSRFFRVATEGATTDGRVIDRTTIIELANSFNPKTYGARIWLEHIRGMVPDSIFKAYGDVVAVKCEEVETDNGKKMALFAQISPTPELIALTKARQKIYTSLEINPKFADTGLPYLVGLGITDSPASLGTDILSFSASKGNASPFAERKHNPTNWYSEAVEVALEFDQPVASEHGKLTATLKNLFKKMTLGDTQNDIRFAELSSALESVANVMLASDQQQSAQHSQLGARISELEQSFSKAQADFNAFEKRMTTEDSNDLHRPFATGGEGVLQTNF